MFSKHYLLSHSIVSKGQLTHTSPLPLQNYLSQCSDKVYVTEYRRCKSIMWITLFKHYLCTTTSRFNATLMYTRCTLSYFHITGVVSMKMRLISAVFSLHLYRDKKVQTKHPSCFIREDEQYALTLTKPFMIVLSHTYSTDVLRAFPQALCR